MSNGNWFLIYTKKGQEQKVAESLTAKGILSYCPQNKLVQPWKDRRYSAYRPLFSCYVFACITAEKAEQVKAIPGVLSYVFWLGTPAVIPIDEINAIRNFLGEYAGIKLEKTPVNPKDHVRIIYGPLVVREGSSYEVRNSPVSVILPSLGYVLVAQERKKPALSQGLTLRQMKQAERLDRISKGR